ncbi:MAG: TolC family protein [Chlamydiota bacterium]|nr:TolC family protein [Chlamydiota bacterium]
MMKQCLLVVVYLCVTISINAQDRSLTLMECVHEAFDHNLDVRIESYNPLIAGHRVKSEKGIFDPVVSLSIHKSDSETPLSSATSIAAGGLETIESEDVKADASFQGKIATGLEYQMNLEYSDSQNTFNQFQSEISGKLGFSIVQPLLKDAGTANNKVFIRIAQKSKETADQDFILKVSNLMRDMTRAYWDLVLTREMIALRRESLSLAKSLLSDNQRRASSGLISSLEVDQAQAGVALREEELIMTLQQQSDTQNILKYQMGLNIREWLETVIIPLDEPQSRPIDLVRDVLIEEGLQRRAVYQKALLEIEKVNLLVKYYRNQLFPRIDLEASLSANGIENAFSDLSNELLGFNKQQWMIGATLRMPLSRIKDKHQYQISKLQSTQALVQLKRLEQTIALEIDRAAGHVETYQKSIVASEVTVRFSQKALEAEQKKYDAGMSTSYQVLEYQEQLLEAKIRHIKALCELEKSIIDLYCYQGKLLEQLGVRIDERQ